jgi:hypothetical protein
MYFRGKGFLDRDVQMGNSSGLARSLIHTLVAANGPKGG